MKKSRFTDRQILPILIIVRFIRFMNQQIKARLTWVNLYLETKDAEYVCRKCGISCPTLWKWYKRSLEVGSM